MKKASAPAPVSAQGQPAQREQLPMKVDVKINTLRTDARSWPTPRSISTAASPSGA